MKPNPLEKHIESKVVSYAQQHGMLVYKFTSPQRRSVPDRLFIPKGKPPFFIEFKRFGCYPTTAQEVEIAKIRAQGVKVYVVDNVEQGKVIVDLEVLS